MKQVSKLDDFFGKGNRGKSSNQSLRISLEMKYTALFAGSAFALEIRDVRTAQRNTEEHIRVYNNQIMRPGVRKQPTTEADLDTFTGAILKFRSKNLPRKSDSYESTIGLFKKLNLRSIVNFIDIDTDFYDEYENGPFSEAISDYGCWCLPQQGHTGLGEPVDELDQICYEFNTCLQCLSLDECKTNQLTYEWQKGSKSAKF